MTKKTEPAEPSTGGLPVAIPTTTKSHVVYRRQPTDHLPILDVSKLPSTTLMRTLAQALTLRRDYGSTTEAAFVGWLANRLPVTLIDAAGNLHVDLRTEPHHRTMFTSHTDTVHFGGGRNKVHVDGNFWRASEGSALGADDGAGIALMCHMIEAGVPGYYLFCRGEERGGVGSTWLAKEMKSVFKNIDYAIAFDRAGYDDVITHQSCGRCCSNKFADELSRVLSTEIDWFSPSSSGVYTDTAEFVDMVPECTNISVGYKYQHGDEEQLDVVFLERLAERLVQINWDALPVDRDPTKPEPRVRYYWPPAAGTGISDAGEWTDPDPVGAAIKAEGARRVATANGTEEDEDEIEDQDEDEFYLMVALEAAVEGDFRDLLNMIAEHSFPSDPDTVLPLFSARRLGVIHLEEAMDELGQGFTANEVLEHLSVTAQGI